MSKESIFRGICEFCTGTTFICFLLKLSKSNTENIYSAVVGSAIVILFTWLLNIELDEDGIKTGIQSHKVQKSSHVFVCISKIRFRIESFSSYLLLLLIVAYLITVSNKEATFKTIAYYEVKLIVLEIMSVSIFLFITSLFLTITQKIPMKNNVMKRMLQ